MDNRGKLYKMVVLMLVLFILYVFKMKGYRTRMDLNILSEYV